MEGLTKKERLWLRLMAIGHRAGCHQMASRSFFFRGYQFPLCARCTGILIGHILGAVLYFCKVRISLPMLFIMWIPCAADGLLQRYTPYVSNNLKRILTGIIVGISYIQLLFMGIHSLWNLIFS